VVGQRSAPLSQMCDQGRPIRVSSSSRLRRACENIYLIVVAGQFRVCRTLRITGRIGIPARSGSLGRHGTVRFNAPALFGKPSIRYDRMLEVLLRLSSLAGPVLKVRMRLF
jgi:hypothetical protein